MVIKCNDANTLSDFNYVAVDDANTLSDFKKQTSNNPSPDA